MKKFIALTSIVLAYSSTALSAEFVCKVKPQLNEPTASQVTGTYTLKEKKNRDGKSIGLFTLDYENADGSGKETIVDQAYLSIKSKDSEDAEISYEDGYLEAVEGYPGYTPIPWKNVGYSGRVFVGVMEGPHRGTEFMIGFILGAGATPTDVEILDIYGVIAHGTRESYFLCEKLKTNPKRLPEPRRAG